MKHKWLLPGVLLVSLLLAGAVLAQAAEVNWWVIAGGGGRDTNGSVTLDSVVGQWVSGSDTTGSTQVNAGFLITAGGAGPTHRIFLPLVLKSSGS